MDNLVRLETRRHSSRMFQREIIRQMRSTFYLTEHLCGTAVQPATSVSRTIHATAHCFGSMDQQANTGFLQAVYETHLMEHGSLGLDMCLRTTDATGKATTPMKNSTFFPKAEITAGQTMTPPILFQLEVLLQSQRGHLTL